MTVISNGSISGNSYHQHHAPRALLTTPPAFLPPHHLHHQPHFPIAPSFGSSAASTLCCLMCSSPITFHVGALGQQQHPSYRSNSLRHFLPSNTVPVPLLACIPCGRWCDSISGRRNNWLTTTSLLWPNQLFIRLITSLLKLKVIYIIHGNKSLFMPFIFVGSMSLMHLCV